MTPQQCLIIYGLPLRVEIAAEQLHEAVAVFSHLLRGRCIHPVFEQKEFLVEVVNGCAITLLYCSNVACIAGSMAGLYISVPCVRRKQNALAMPIAPRHQGGLHPGPPFPPGIFIGVGTPAPLKERSLMMLQTSAMVCSSTCRPSSHFRASRGPAVSSPPANSSLRCHGAVPPVSNHEQIDVLLSADMDRILPHPLDMKPNRVRFFTGKLFL